MKGFVKIIKIIFAVIAGYGIYDHLKGLSQPDIVNSLSYFTMQSNILCFVILIISIVNNGERSKNFDILYGVSVVSITLTFFIFNFVLANSDFTMRAMQEEVTVDTGDIFVHYLVPVIMWIDFIFFTPHRIFSLSYVTKWLVFPVVYFLAVMSKAMLLTYYNVEKTYKRYPYDFMNTEINGWPYLMSYIGIFTLVCIVIGCVICVLDFVLGMIYTKKQC